MPPRSGLLLTLLLLVAAQARAQALCGDLDLDGDVDADDALILRDGLADASAMSLAQALACDVLDEARSPGLEPDPADAAGRCSMSDAAVMSRHGDGLLPGPAQVCALGSSGDCCSAHGGVGCNAPDTVECVCAADPSCCTVDWDAECAGLACQTSCAPTCSPASFAYCSGACRDLDTDPAHCGACEAPCSLPHASATCEAGVCALADCEAGFANCDRDAATGCEVLLDTAVTCLGTPRDGSVDGDGVLSAFSVSGRGNRIVRVRVSESDPSVGVDLTARFRLAPPPGTDYDLSVRCESCSAPPRSAPAPGPTWEIVEVGRDDTRFDDSFDVLVEIRWVSGDDCASWSLHVLGNSGGADRSCN